MLDIEKGNSRTIPARTPKKRMGGYFRHRHGSRPPPGTGPQDRRPRDQSREPGGEAHETETGPKSRIAARCAESDGEGAIGTVTERTASTATTRALARGELFRRAVPANCAQPAEAME